MHTNSYAPIMVSGPGSRKPKVDPNCKPQSNAARRRVETSLAAARQRDLERADAELSWQLRAAAKRDATRAIDYMPIGEEAGAELRRMVTGE